ncbi:hypothetical protein SAMN05443428_13517 [Caloramator quimbayensis]|uniref:Uncharacterized protein n=1 Tax=Caloramator quimbayensis TaxID=1147123 RepID=A0A1T4YC45_9CLOT|nr:hypothetical protein [Caloramator quimbayensis]SKA99346.1 hypothetical protein SAMN05443428_13517 [Caloramator quimbayensis]
MITLTDIQRAISRKLYGEFGSEYYIYTEEVKKELKRPSFFIDVIPVLTENFVDYKDKLINIDIMYFSKNETNEENLRAINIFEQIFNSVLEVQGNTISIKALNYKVVDNILHCSFTLDFTDNEEPIEINTQSEPLYIMPSDIDEALDYKEDSIRVMQELDIE